MYAEATSCYTEITHCMPLNGFNCLSSLCAKAISGHTVVLCFMFFNGFNY